MNKLRSLLAVIATVAAVSISACGAATTEPSIVRGEASVQLPTHRLPVRQAADIIRTPRWSRPADPPPSDLDDTVDSIATGAGIVAFSSGGRFCGMAEDGGTLRWCADSGSAPVFARGIIAYRRAAGGIDAVDARSGRSRWRYVASAGDALPSQGPGPSIPQVVWAVPDGFLMAPVRDDATLGYTIGEVDAAGSLRWAADRRAHVDPPVIDGEYALQTEIGSGAAMFGTLHIYKLGRGGGLVGTVAHALAVLDRRPSAVVVSGDQMLQVEAFLRADVWVAAVPSGQITERFHYAPDLVQNEREFSAGRLAQTRAVMVDGGYVYVAVGSNVYRYRLAAARGQRPLRIVSDGRLLVGPYHGTIYVARAQGVWSYRPRARYVEARLVAPSRAAAVLATRAGDTAYFGFADGHIVGVDADDGTTKLDAKICPPAQLVVSLRQAYVRCSGRASRVFDFRRPK